MNHLTNLTSLSPAIPFEHTKVLVGDAPSAEVTAYLAGLVRQSRATEAMITTVGRMPLTNAMVNALIPTHTAIMSAATMRRIFA